MKKKIRLGVNIDHVATLRNARNEDFPNLLEVASILKKINVDLITVHLREDRRHIKDQDVKDLMKSKLLPINLEMAATEEMKDICLETKPNPQHQNNHVEFIQTSINIIKHSMCTNAFIC